MQAGTSNIRSRNILGVPVAVLSKSEALNVILDNFNASRSTSVAFANANLLMKARRDPKLRRQLDGMLILNDGIGVDIASWLLYGETFPANLNGTDFTPEVLKTLPKRTSVFLYGSRPDVVRKTAESLRREYEAVICGTCDGYVSDSDLAIRQIESANPKVVLVALGNPRQEQWMSEKGGKRGTLTMGIGAYFDFVSGKVPRAPVWLQRLRCEWVFRLLQEPRRLWRRYTVDVICFLAVVITDRIRMSSRVKQRSSG